MSNFAFLQSSEWLFLSESAAKSEALANTDARASCFYARRTLELALAWLYKHDGSLHLPYQDHLSALIHEPTFRQAVGEALFTKAKLIKDLGNLAVHSHRTIAPGDALAATRELFHVCYWLARTYGRKSRPAPGLRFSAELLPKPSAAPAQSLEQLQTLEAQLHERDAKLSAVLSDKAALDAELQQLREEVAAIKQANAKQPDTHDYSEAETRDYFIDLLLKEAGWALDKPQDREFEVRGMPASAPLSQRALNPLSQQASDPPRRGESGESKDRQQQERLGLSGLVQSEAEVAEGRGFVDYVLWGDDGKPLGLVEAKRTRKDATVGQQQAKLYADCLEKMYGQRPVIFYSNGYEHWLWDDARYPPRAAQGFFKKAELELLIQRRSTRKKLAEAVINADIAGRYYQTRAIRRIGQTFEIDNQRKALVVMATGAGKTRTVIALADLLMRCN